MGTDDPAAYSGPERRSDGWIYQRLGEMGIQVEAFDKALAEHKDDFQQFLRLFDQERKLDDAEHKADRARIRTLEEYVIVEKAERAQTLRLLRWGLGVVTLMSLLFGIVLAYGRLTGQPV